MPKIKSKLSRLYQSKKVNVLALFVLLALLFSLLTKLSRDYTKTISFDVEMLNVPDEHVILKDSLQKINVTMTSYGFSFLKYYFINPSLKVDFNNLKNSNQSYLWTKNNEFQNVANQFSTSAVINSISPDTIYFNYDSYFVKTIPIKLNEDVSFASGFDVDGSYIIQPDSLKVIGAKSVLDSINSIETMPLVIDNINANISTSIKLKLPNENPDIKFSEDKVLVSARVNKFTEGSLIVPVVVKNLPEGINIKYFPKEVEVVFYTSLDYYKTIAINNFKIECDFTKLSLDNKLVPIITKQPDKVKNVRLSTKSIEFIIL